LRSTAEAKRRGRPADPLKREAIIEVARRLFFEYGYGTGLDAIAAEAGVSRQTIYNLFSSKDDLFAAIVQDTSGQITAPLAHLAPGAMPHQVLTLLGESFLHTIASEPMTKLQRLLITSAADFPGIGPAFYENGPGRGVLRLSAYLQRETDAGHLTVTDPTLAAEQFFGMLIGHTALKRMLRLQDPISEAEIRHRVDSAVTAFLRAYSPVATAAH